MLWPSLPPSTTAWMQGIRPVKFWRCAASSAKRLAQSCEPWLQLAHGGVPHEGRPPTIGSDADAQYVIVRLPLGAAGAAAASSSCSEKKSMVASKAAFRTRRPYIRYIRYTYMYSLYSAAECDFLAAISLPLMKLMRQLA